MMRKAVRFCRSLLSGSFFIAYGAFSLPFAVLLLLPFWKDAHIRMMVRLFYRSFVFLAGASGLYRVKVIGDGLDTFHGMLVVANHVSLIDICVLMALLPDSTTLAKSAVLRNPFLSMVVKKSMLVNGENPRETVNAVGRCLAAGINVIVFPQGTRGGTIWHRGAAHFALESGAKVACIRLSYSPEVLAKHQPWWDVGDRIIEISVENLGIITPEESDGHVAAVQLTEKIKEIIG